MSNSQESHVLINYYLRKGWYESVQRLCEEYIEKRGNDSTILFWRAFSIAMEKNWASSIREFEKLKSQKSVELPCLRALIFAHNLCKNIDREAVSQLEMQVCMAEENTSDHGKLLCANFYWQINEHGKARKILEALLGGNKTSNSQFQHRAAVLRGWIDLTTECKTKRDLEIRMGSIHYFNQVENSKDAELLLGIAKHSDLSKNYQRALECYDELTVRYPWFSEHSITEKALISIKAGNWTQCIDFVDRVLSDHPKNIDALRLMILYLVTQVGNYKKAAEMIHNLADALRKSEPSNSNLYYEYSKCIARISDGNYTVLQCNLALVEQAVNLNPESGKFRAELGFQYSLLEDFAGAIVVYKEALRLDESNEMALHGLIFCQVKLGQLDDASQQMEFLSIIQESLGNSCSFFALQALFSWEKDKDLNKQISFIQQAIKLHMENLKNSLQQYPDANSHDMITMLNPIFLVQMATELIKHSSSLGITQGKGREGSDVTAVLMKGQNILDKLVKKSPGFIRAQYVLAEVHFTSGKANDAYSICSEILKMDPSHCQSHLLQARIFVERNQYKGASASLDQALSHDFSIRQSVAYNVIKAKILEQDSELNEALQALQIAKKIICTESKSDETSSTKTTFKKKNLVPKFQPPREIIVSVYDNASVYIQLAEVYSSLNNIQDATAIIHEALSTFRDTPQEIRVLVSNSELAVKRGEYESAIALLSTIPQTSPSFAKAQMIKADIFLQHRKDKNLYARCYQELVVINPSYETHLGMAEAYMRIQKLDLAVESLRQAATYSPNDTVIPIRIGKILVSKHDYLAAVNYYESALKTSPSNFILRKNLTQLYIKLRHFDQALTTIKTAPDTGNKELAHLQQAVELKLLLPDVYKGLENLSASIESLIEIAGLQEKVLFAQKEIHPDDINDQKQAIATTYFKIANLYAEIGVAKEKDNFLKYANLSLKFNEALESMILLLATAHYQLGDVDQCQSNLTALLRLNPSHEEAAVLLVDLMVSKNDHESAIFHFQQLLEEKPENFTVLSRYISMLRRAGKLSNVPRYLKLAELAGVRIAHSPGLHFCKGLYAWYKNDIRQAIEHFNFVRRDPEWGEQALINMIEIYLNPDNESLWSAGENSLSGSAEGNTKEQSEYIRIANTLLNELPLKSTDKSKSFRIKVLEAYAVMAVKTKGMLDKATQLFTDILDSHDRDYVPALVGLAIVHTLNKQEPKARNILKRIDKMPHNSAFTEEFERAYLMLADIYVSKSKFDLAQVLCKKALVHNKSSGKAWEILGLIMEKEQSYIDAADCYQEAWQCEGEASASLGFRLAFNLLKAKKLVKTVDVCYKVLDMYPDYPKIRKEILDIAYAGFRP